MPLVTVYRKGIIMKLYPNHKSLPELRTNTDIFYFDLETFENVECGTRNCSDCPFYNVDYEENYYLDYCGSKDFLLDSFADFFRIHPEYLI